MTVGLLYYIYFLNDRFTYVEWDCTCVKCEMYLFPNTQPQTSNRKLQTEVQGEGARNTNMTYNSWVTQKSHAPKCNLWIRQWTCDFYNVMIYYDVHLFSVALLDSSPLLQWPLSTTQAIPLGLLCVNGPWSCCSSACSAFLQLSSDTSTATTSLCRNTLSGMTAALPQ